MSNPIINAGPNGVSTVKDGSTTITNASTIDFTSGATVSDLGGGVAGVSISGGGGGSYTYGNGIYFSGTSPTTIGNTGTIIQPVATGTNSGLGVLLRGGAPGTASSGSYYYPGPFLGYAGQVSAAGTASYVQGANAVISGSTVTLTDPAGIGYSGGAGLRGGEIINGTIGANGGGAQSGVATISGTSLAVGGGPSIYSGPASGAVTNIVSPVYITGGYANGGDTAKAGGIILTPGTASGAVTNVNGILIVNNIGTDDPHVLNAKFQQSIVGVGWVGVYSQG